MMFGLFDKKQIALYLLKSIVVIPLTYVGSLIVNRFIEFWYLWGTKIKERDNFSNFYKFCVGETDPSFRDTTTVLCNTARITKDRSPIVQALHEFSIKIQNDFSESVSVAAESYIGIAVIMLIVVIVTYKLLGSITGRDSGGGMVKKYYNSKGEQHQNQQQQYVATNFDGTPINVRLNSIESEMHREFYLLGIQAFQEKQQRQRKRLSNTPSSSSSYEDVTSQYQQPEYRKEMFLKGD